jgi:hypothetical protein
VEWACDSVCAPHCAGVLFVPVTAHPGWAGRGWAGMGWFLRYSGTVAISGVALLYVCPVVAVLYLSSGFLVSFLRLKRVSPGYQALDVDRSAHNKSCAVFFCNC